MFRGKAILKVKSCKTTLKDAATDRNVCVTIKTCKKKAAASIELLPTGDSFSISDNDTANNTCACKQ
jgi:hypothetical protein